MVIIDVGGMFLARARARLRQSVAHRLDASFSRMKLLNFKSRPAV